MCCPNGAPFIGFPLLFPQPTIAPLSKKRPVPKKDRLLPFSTYSQFRPKTAHCILVGVWYNELKICKEVISMAYKITDECIACGTCASECPVEAITEGDGIFVIDADACIECGNCANVCPVGAPKAE
jgi:ferredoxin